MKVKLAILGAFFLLVYSLNVGCTCHKRESPLIEVSEIIVAELGGVIEYSPYLSLGGSSVSFSVDESGLDLYRVGIYTVYACGVDAKGRRGECVPIRVEVVDSFDKNRLDDMLGEIVSGLSIEGKSKEAICRDIYRTVRERLVYNGESEKGDLCRSAYYALCQGGGDCYSYFALSKLLLDLCGIENMDIQREEGYTSDTHYWHLVNIGDGCWYHFDTTELKRDKYLHSGCLLTDMQIMAYSKARKDFYRYDAEDYPSVSEKIITPTPNLECLY